MSTVRFSKVMERAGKPEIFLLLSKDDPAFKKALKGQRIMSLLSSGAGQTEYGEVGYAEKKRPQLLIFPKTLRGFEGDRIVGIRYREFSEEAPERPAQANPKSKAGKKKAPGSRSRKADRKKETESEPVPKKVIPFPKTETQQEDGAEDDGILDLKRSIREALRLLEKGNAVAAYNLLKHSVN